MAKRKEDHEGEKADKPEKPKKPRAPRKPKKAPEEEEEVAAPEPVEVQPPPPPPPVIQKPEEEEEEEDEDDEIVAKPSQTIGREETKALLDTFDEVATNRYEAFRRAHLPKQAMRKMVSSLVGPVPQSVAIVVSGVGKVFIGEIVEEALDIQQELGHSGPLTPEHILEAFRLYQKKRKAMKNKLYQKALFLQ